MDDKTHKASLKLGLILGKVEMTRVRFEATNYTFNEQTRQGILKDFKDIEESILIYAGEFLS